MIKFRGYKIQSTNIKKIETILKAARENMSQAANEIYHKLVSEEVACLVDDIALNVIQKPDCQILDAAAGRTFDKIRFAESRNLPTEYNLAASVQLIPGKDCVYLMYIGESEFLEEAFASAKGIEDYSVSLETTENTIMTEREKIWLSLQKKAEQSPPVLLANYGQRLALDKSLLTFASVHDRAEERARHEMTNEYINMYANGQQIAPYELMRLTDKALSMMLEEKSEARLRELTEKLSRILPEITLELITGEKEQVECENTEEEEKTDSPATD